MRYKTGYNSERGYSTGVFNKVIEKEKEGDNTVDNYQNTSRFDC